MTRQLSPAQLEKLGGIPKWLDQHAPVKACHYCGEPVRLMSVKDTGMTHKVYVVDAAPHGGGWVRVYLGDRSISYRPRFDRNLLAETTDPFIPFGKHRCPVRIEQRESLRRRVP